MFKGFKCQILPVGFMEEKRQGEEEQGEEAAAGLVSLHQRACGLGWGCRAGFMRPCTHEGFWVMQYEPGPDL